MFVCFCVTDEHPFTSAGRIPFSISRKESPVWWTLPAFVCLGTFYFILFFCLHFRRTASLDSVFLAGLFFSFSTVNVSSTLSWSVRFLLRNPQISSVGSFVDCSFFLLCFQDSTFDFWQFHYNVFWERLLWLEIMRWSVNFMNLNVQVSLQVWEVLRHEISK